MRPSLAFLFFSTALAACTHNNNVSSDEAARRAYLGINAMVGKAILLGFDGFNMASSANISPQMTNGDAAGTVTITGQVDQGSSANKTMRLNIALTGYSDGKVPIDTANPPHTETVTYATGATLPSLQLDLMGIPTGTLSGTLMGDFTMTGDLTGSVMLDLSMSGMLMSGPNMTVLRKTGSTTVTGTATDGNGVYQVNVTI
jgi:hypothetical protein